MARRGHPPEFRQRVIDLVEGGREVAEVAIELQVSEQTIYTWRHQANAARIMNGSANPVMRPRKTQDTPKPPAIPERFSSPTTRFRASRFPLVRYAHPESVCLLRLGKEIRTRPAARIVDRLVMVADVGLAHMTIRPRFLSKRRSADRGIANVSSTSIPFLF